MASNEVDPGLPIKLNRCSNGEFAPPPPTQIAIEAMRRARAESEANARRVGIDRRIFLRSICGAATGLVALAACTSDEAANRGEEPGGTFTLPPDSTVDPDAARDVLAGEEFILDVQNHLLQYDLSSPLGSYFGSGFPQARCGSDDPRACFAIDAYLPLIFIESDTTMAVLSAIPVLSEPHPLSIEVMMEAQAVAAAAGCDGRLLLQGQALPTVGPLEAALDGMTAVANQHQISAWKVYTHAAGDPWFLDDHDPKLAQVGQALIDRARETGVPRIAVHKGLSGGSRFADPVDIGPAAAANPDVAFLIYHSGHESGAALGSLNLDSPAGVDRLIATARAHDLGPGDNVYAELGSTWRQLMGDPTGAAHVLGKLLSQFGPDNILWGTDSLWYGSPQDQIQAFRAFEISEQLQETHGYPALDAETKAKILGLNAARLHGIDPPTVTCDLDRTELEQVRLEAPASNATLGPTTAEQAHAVFATDHPWA